MNWINSAQPSFSVAFGITTPIYASTNGTITNTRIIDVTTPRPKTEVSPIEDATIYLVGNVSNTGTYVETIESLNVTRGERTWYYNIFREQQQGSLECIRYGLEDQ